MKYHCKLVSTESGTFDPGFFTISPKVGTLSAGVDEVFTVKFNPTEVEETNIRLLVISIENLDPQLEPLIIELDGEAERPICHFELPQSNFRKKKA